MPFRVKIIKKLLKIVEKKTFICYNKRTFKQNSAILRNRRIK